MLIDKDARHMIRINSIDLSYNQLNFLSFFGLFDLFKCWCTTEIMANDTGILENSSVSQLLTCLENTFIVRDIETSLQTASIGSFIFVYNLNANYIFSDIAATQHDSIYLLNCTISEDLNLLISLHQHKPVIVHILETNINEITVKAISDMLINNGNFSSLYII